MKICARVKPNSRQEKIDKLDESNFILWVKSPAKENKANEAAVELLSSYFDVPKSMITLLKGRASRLKIFKIETI